jgi:hypothetical protein
VGWLKKVQKRFAQRRKDAKTLRRYHQHIHGVLGPHKSKLSRAAPEWLEICLERLARGDQRINRGRSRRRGIVGGKLEVYLEIGQPCWLWLPNLDTFRTFAAQTGL